MKNKILILILCTILLFSLNGCSGSSPSSTVKSFYNAVNNGDYEKAIGYLSDQVVSSFGIAKLESAIQLQAETLSANGGIKSVNIVDETIYDENAVVEVEIEYGDGSVTTESVQLIKEDGEWKIGMGK